MSLKFGILGLGQCGGSIAEYAITKGFKAVVANTAKVDLDQIKYISNDCKLHLGGKGAGRSREIGQNTMIENAEMVYNKCLEEFKDCDAVLVAASGGGGTGSGALPVAVDILTSINKYVAAILVLPEKSESPKSKMNTLECFKQLTEIENLGSIFIIDNNKVKELHPTFSRKIIYSVANKQIIDYLCQLNELTDLPSYVSNFDASDLLSIIEERGYTLISKSEYLIDKVENEYELADRVRKSWENSYQPNFEGGQIVKGAIIGKIEEDASININPELIFQETGMPYDFNDIYFYPEDTIFDNKKKNEIFTILSGLSFPNGRLNEIEDQIKDVEDKLVINFNNSQNQTFNTESWNSKFVRKQPINLDLSQPTKKPKQIDVMEKLNKYK